VTCVTTQVKASEMGKTCSTHVRGEEIVQGYGGRARWNGPLERARRRWENEIRMDIGEIGLGDVDWIRLAEDRDQWRVVVSAVMNLLFVAPRS
jgi:hypothetical protein